MMAAVVAAALPAVSMRRIGAILRAVVIMRTVHAGLRTVVAMCRICTVYAITPHAGHENRRFRFLADPRMAVLRIGAILRTVVVMRNIVAKSAAGMIMTFICAADIIAPHAGTERQSGGSTHAARRFRRRRQQNRCVLDFYSRRHISFCRCRGNRITAAPCQQNGEQNPYAVQSLHVNSSSRSYRFIVCVRHCRAVKKATAASCASKSDGTPHTKVQCLVLWRNVPMPSSMPAAPPTALRPHSTRSGTRQQPFRAHRLSQPQTAKAMADQASIHHRQRRTITHSEASQRPCGRSPGWLPGCNGAWASLFR